MLKVEYLRSTQLPSNFTKILPKTCLYCGESLYISDSLNYIECINSECYLEPSNRMLAILSNLGIKGVSLNMCIGYLKKFNTFNPYHIFNYNPITDGEFYDNATMKVSEKIYNQLKVRNKLSLLEYILIGDFSNLNDSLVILFSKYPNIDELYSLLEEEGISFLNNLFEIESESLAVKVIELYVLLYKYKNHWLDGLKGVELKEKIILNVIIDGDEELDLKYYNEKYDNLYLNKTYLLEIADIYIKGDMFRDTTLYKEVLKLNNIPIIGTRELEGFLGQIYE